jgi:protein-tyrosine phosphatase
MASDRPARVLFVCLGNICRSPAAEAVLRKAVAENGYDGLVEIDSAGTGSYHVGEPPDARMSRAAAERGIELAGSARQVERTDFERFDLIVAMDRENLRNLERLAGGQGHRLRLLGDFLAEDGASGPDVPDPYYGGGRGFEVVLDMLEEAAPRVLEAALDAARQPSGQ